jgi:hypothetical protein
VTFSLFLAIGAMGLHWHIQVREFKTFLNVEHSIRFFIMYLVSSAIAWQNMRQTGRVLVKRPKFSVGLFIFFFVVAGIPSAIELVVQSRSAWIEFLHAYFLQGAAVAGSAVVWILVALLCRLILADTPPDCEISLAESIITCVLVGGTAVALSRFAQIVSRLTS